MDTSDMDFQDYMTENILLKQAERLQSEMKIEFDLKTTFERSKEIVARLYQFDHWHLLSSHLRLSKTRSSDSRFKFSHLNPSTIDEISPSIVDEMSIRKKYYPKF